MRHVIIFCFLIAAASACSYKILRTGYVADKAAPADCEITIRKNVVVTEGMKKVGEIRLGETGVSTSCSEAHALEIPRKEGCSVHANLVNIIHETQPDAWSSCYRCTAEFYQTDSPDTTPSGDSQYDDGLVADRVTEDRKRNSGMVILAVAVGFLIGFLIVQ